MKKQTPVEFLIKEFSDLLGPLDTKPMQDLLMMDSIKRAKEMEKIQIIDAYNEGDNNGADRIYYHSNRDDKSAEQYYNETFKSE